MLYPSLSWKGGWLLSATGWTEALHLSSRLPSALIILSLWDNCSAGLLQPKRAWIRNPAISLLPSTAARDELKWGKRKERRRGSCSVLVCPIFSALGVSGTWADGAECWSRHVWALCCLSPSSVLQECPNKGGSYAMLGYLTLRSCLFSMGLNLEQEYNFFQVKDCCYAGKCLLKKKSKQLTMNPNVLFQRTFYDPVYEWSTSMYKKPFKVRPVGTYLRSVLQREGEGHFSV